MSASAYDEAIVYIRDREYEHAVNILTRSGILQWEAWAIVAGVLYTGTDVDKRLNHAIEIWTKLSAEGDAHSQQVLGAVLIRSDDHKKILEGVEWLEKAGKQGKAYALVNLAQIYYAGHGPLPADPKRCIDYFQRAVDLGDTEAMITLAHYYSIGFGVKQSNEKYIELNQLAADAGNVKGNYNLGVSFEFGHFGPIDDDLAFKHYLVAAEGGIPEAQHNLGARYFNGKGTPQDKQRGIACYLSAAANDSNLSQHCLGLACMSGDGLPKSDINALSWFMMACKNGSTDSAPFVEELRKKLSAEEVKQSVELCESFKERFASIVRNSERVTDGLTDATE